MFFVTRLDSIKDDIQPQTYYNTNNCVCYHVWWYHRWYETKFLFFVTRFDGFCDDVITVGHGLIADLEEAVDLDGTITFLKKFIKYKKKL